MASAQSSYSQETMVAAITSYYEFLKQTHSDSNCVDIKCPPPGGWPQITPELFNMYSDTVVNLLRHLPYFDSEGFCILEKTEAVNYIMPIRIKHLAAESEKRKARLEEPIERLKLEEFTNGAGVNDQGTGVNGFPSYIVELARGTRDGSSILINTRRGTIIYWKYDVEFLDAALGGDANFKSWCDGKEEEDVDQYGPEAWKAMPEFWPWSFVEMCKNEFRSMNWIPVLSRLGRGDVICVRSTEEEEYEELKQIMKDAGWPGDGEAGGWDKEGAERAMEKMSADIHGED